MSLKRTLRTIFMCAALELGVISGVPVRPEEIRALMSRINGPELAHVLPDDDQRDDTPSRYDFALNASTRLTGPADDGRHVGLAPDGAAAAAALAQDDGGARRRAG